VLGYPAELVPLDNPYQLKRGGMLRIRVLFDGQPVGNQAVVAGGRGAGGTAIAPVSLRTDVDGIVSVPLSAAGRWYVKCARMRPAGLDGINYESQRSTLTFEVR
jgi:uncharacterized GH25 family protein